MIDGKRFFKIWAGVATGVALALAIAGIVVIRDSTNIREQLRGALADNAALQGERAIAQESVERAELGAESALEQLGRARSDSDRLELELADRDRAIGEISRQRDELEGQSRRDREIVERLVGGTGDGEALLDEYGRLTDEAERVVRACQANGCDQ